eukprot:Rhum_TRINITY_DN3630_c0_g1::Rhum_TRINITY_DN3630_c0_g1_i1::g.11570::m.11570
MMLLRRSALAAARRALSSPPPTQSEPQQPQSLHGPGSAFNLGRMVAHCAAVPSFQRVYERTFEPSTASRKSLGWAAFVEPPPGDFSSVDVARQTPRIVGIDVEMAERRSARKHLRPHQVAIMGSIVEAVYFEGQFHVQASRGGSFFIDPGCAMNENDFDWKTETHGITHESYTRAVKEGKAVPLADVQKEVLQCAALPSTCLVGHMLSHDLDALQIYGANLRSKIIDTAFYFGSRDNGTAYSLVEVANRHGVLSRRQGVHDPLEDATMAVRVVESELHRLCTPGAELPARNPPTVSDTRGVLLINDKDVTPFIGPRGVNLKKVRQETGSRVVVCTLAKPSETHSYVTYHSQTPALLATTKEMLQKILKGKLFEM